MLPSNKTETISPPHDGPEAILAKRSGQDFSDELAKTGWYHSMELPSGVIQGFLSLDDLRRRWSEFPLPEDLTGARLLDIGTWDGWFAFEPERRGAHVVAVDNVTEENFYQAHGELKSKWVPSTKRCSSACSTTCGTRCELLRLFAH